MDPERYSLLGYHVGRIQAAMRAAENDGFVFEIGIHDSDVWLFGREAKEHPFDTSPYEDMITVFDDPGYK